MFCKELSDGVDGEGCVLCAWFGRLNQILCKLCSVYASVNELGRIIRIS